MSRLAAILFCLAMGASAVQADARKDCFEKSGDAAIRACTAALQADPRDTVSYVNRAFEYQQKGAYASAIDDYSKAIDLDANRVDALQGRAWAHFKAGNAAQGLDDAERALKIQPTNAQALDTRGHIYEAMGRREDAIADFRRALSLQPRLQGSREALQRLGIRP